VGGRWKGVGRWCGESYHVVTWGGGGVDPNEEEGEVWWVNASGKKEERKPRGSKILYTYIMETKDV